MSNNNLKVVESTNYISNIICDVQFWQPFYGASSPQDAARPFIEALTGSPDTCLFWQSIEDNGKSEKSAKLYQNAPYAEVIKACKEYNQAGHGIFVAVNQIEGSKRKQEYVTKFRAAFMDVDGKGDYMPLDKLVLPVKPTVVTARDLNHYHVYFALKGDVTLEQWTALQRCLIRRYHSDETMVDSAKVLRVPGYQHLKDPDNPMVYYLMRNDKNARYTFEELAKGLGVEDEDYKPCQQKTDKPKISYKKDRSVSVENFISECKKRPPAVSNELGNNHTYQLAAWGAGKGLSESVILGIMSAVYNPRCLPPWDYSKLAEIVHNAWLYSQNKGGETPEALMSDVEASKTQAQKRFNVLDIKNFLKEDLPVRGHMVEPWLPEQGLAMIYAERGVGKTYLALSIAYAVACGGDKNGEFLNWKIPQPRNVMYLDGEMPAGDLQQRLKALHRYFGETKAGFKLLAYDLQRDFNLKLAYEEDRKGLEKHLKEEGTELIVVDNISTLCAAGKENEAESWEAIQDWATGQRREGRSVLFIHHANKTGGQRGTSRREDVLDTVIGLRHPADYEPEQGAVFKLSFEKSRGFYGESAKPVIMELKLEADFIDKNNVDMKHGWIVKPLEKSNKEKVLALVEEGLSNAEIAKEVGITHFSVRRILKKVGAKSNKTV